MKFFRITLAVHKGHNLLARGNPTSSWTVQTAQSFFLRQVIRVNVAFRKLENFREIHVE